MAARQLTRLARADEEHAANVDDGSSSNDRRANLIEAADRFESMTSLATTQR